MNRISALLAVTALAFAPTASVAATSIATPPAQYQGPGGSYVPANVAHGVGIDSVTGQPCLLGLTATCAPVGTGNLVSVTPTIQNASYVSGNCMGGFQAVSLGNVQSVLNALTLISKGGLVTAKQIYLFSANPSGSTCTDRSTFTIAVADRAKEMMTFSITPTVPTGDTASTATQSSLGLGIPPGGVVYMAIVETVTETPTSPSDLLANFSDF